MNSAPKKFWTLLALALAANLLLGCQTTLPPANAQGQAAGTLSTQERIRNGKALFDEKCKTVAGEKIYKTVPDVDGVLLLKVRPRVGGREWADKMWPGAAFAKEAPEDEYVTSFLGAELSILGPDRKALSISKDQRGFIAPLSPEKLAKSARPGYRYVDVIDEKDGKRYRFTGSEKVVGKQDTSAYNVQLAMRKNPNYDLNVYRWTLDKVPAPGGEPRYAVTYEDHVIPEERTLWLASSTVKVIDRQTDEVLGEMTRYAWSAGAPSPANPSPWLSAYSCPKGKGLSGYATRMFVDQILIPAKEK